MRFFNTASPLIGLLAMCASTAPTTTISASANGTVVPVPKYTTYDAELAAAIAFARAAGLNNPSTGLANSDTQCGQYKVDEGSYNVPTFASNSICQNTVSNTHMNIIANWACGLCIVFDGRACQGSIRWTGGPQGYVSHAVEGAQSYFCY
ncbi:hypothetical protein EJ02DRAFT_432778 [Clathrospora elynae]|uniref:Uncharacterized protein n=1 Tax=Clathrospora elynae TaxID=706981 RepID=A0A6A5STR4_9PLEO|nr:hypothetical protein EJ02DRAFT_432778 [Clathrospora elynae]